VKREDESCLTIHQPTTNNQQPTTNNQQPTTNNQQPTTNNYHLYQDFSVYLCFQMTRMNKITQLFGIKYPIIQGGMIWNSGYKLASAVSNHGGLGLIGAGSMYPDILREHIQKCKKATNQPFGVNIPMLYPNLEEIIQIIVEEGVKIVFTSAGNPKTYTSYLKSHGITVVHVVSSSKFALKAQEAGVDAVVAEGFEAGGHNGREETTTFTLIPMVKEQINIPLIAAGGIATGRGMLAAMVLGADGVQLGSRFAASLESSAHDNFKQVIVEVKEGDTQLTLKELAPVRLVKNKFFNEVKALYDKGTNAEELKALLGRARAKRGMFEGDLEEGELEIGQIAGLIHQILPVETIIKQIVEEYQQALNEWSLCESKFHW
jgi:enoyl-[acyl-carrier protein] reductase II